MENPWSILGGRCTHPDDDWHLRQHEIKAKADTTIQKQLVALPFIGDPRTARVVLLGKNPSYDPQDEEDVLRIPDLEEENRKALTFESRYPFFYLDPAFADTNGYRWWNESLGPLVTACEAKGVSREETLSRIAMVQWHPYRSRKAFVFKEKLPTQNYGFELVRAAIRNNALIVIQYGTANDKLWREEINEIPADSLRLKSAQSPHLTVANLTPDGFERVVTKLCAE